MSSAKTAKAMIVAFKGAELTADQEAFFKDVNPFGYILFSRTALGNIQNPDQVRKLTDQLRKISGRDDVPILIDQEGGRVQRLREPQWPELPAARIIGDLYAKDHEAGLHAAHLHTQCIAASLRGIGVNTDCAPVLDLITDGTHNAIGDRGYSTNKHHVITLASYVANEFIKGGIIPTIKHIPGYGQVTDVDPHLGLPVVDASAEYLFENDFRVFRDVIGNLPVGGFYGMNAHLVYKAFDPDTVSTFSEKITRGITRGTAIGFDGLLMADAIEMTALGGTMAERCQRFWAAGGDVALHCTGDQDEIAAIAKIAPDMSDDLWDKQRTAEEIRREQQVYFDDNAPELARELLDLLHKHGVTWAINKISPSN
ncbi:MAG TPA: glycoside hydrolase family 3 N-terminal domain-containing protein [Alphaproteobacteria bacterium]